VRLFAPIRDYVGSLVHASARHDVLNAARHRAFIAPRLLGGLMVLAAFPVVLLVRGVPTVIEAVFFAWFVAPILVAYYLSRTGHFDRASALSALALSALITIVAAATGGLTSFAAIWLVVVPFEAAVSASRRVVFAASALAFAAACLLLITGAAGLLPTSIAAGHDPLALAAMGIASATLYATGIALSVESLTRTSRRLRNIEEARYWLLARNMTDIIVRHGRNGTVLFASPAAEPLLGVAEGELIGHGLFDRVHVADRPAYLKALTDAATGAESCSVEFRIRQGPLDSLQRRSPQFIWIEMRCRPLDQDATASERQVVSVMRDVTERKAQQQVLEAAHAEAQRANATKGRFLATMSHELRTPLNAVIGFSEMLMNDATLNIGPARRRDYAQLINDSGQHLLSVVNGILDMSRIDMGHFEITPEPFVLASVIGNCCDLLALRAREAGIDLVVRHGEAVPEIVADKRAVKQILFNLLANAIKFTESGGQVTVSTTIEGSFVALSVQDTGVGIDEADLPRLGSPFFQVRGSYDRPHDGSGLGLSIVKGLLDLHGGTMEIDSRRGEGTRVTIRLPVDGKLMSHDDRTANVETFSPAAAGPHSADVRMKKRA
jgi:cell cycle sensor histidine kinase DivJ